MPVFVSSLQSTNRHGVFAVERTPPPAITPTGTGVACIVEQFPWGPSQKLTTPAGIKDLYNMICPPGFDRTHQGYLSVIRKAWPNNQLKFVRVLGTAAAPATATVVTAAPATIWTITLKYNGANGNNVTLTVGASSDGVAGHIKLSVTATGASGTTTDIIDNLPTAAAPVPLPDLSKLLLVGSIAFGTGGTAVQQTTNFSTGSDGVIASAQYVGTQGATDSGIALLEGDTSIRHIFCGDPGNTSRAAVNAGLKAHAEYMTDRVAYINGNSGQAASAAVTDVASYRSKRVIYVDPWVYITRDVDGVKTLVPGAPFAASVAAQLSPSTPIAWKNTEVQAMLGGIVDLEADRGANAGTNSDNGIVTFVREASGGFTFESQNVTNTPADGTTRLLSRTRMGDYIATSFVASMRGFVDAPNVPYNQQMILNALEMFMSSLKNAQSVDPNHRPFVLDYQIGNVSSNNTQNDLDTGNFTVGLDVKTASGMEKIGLSIRYGETVSVVHQS